MRVTREVAVAAAPPALWALLWDVPRMVECVPGCVEAREIEAHRRYVARMQQKVGPISLSAPLEVHVVEIEPERRLALEARGRDPVVGAEITLRVALGIEGRDGASLLRIDAEGRVLGKLGALGHGVIQKKAEEAVDEFGARLRRAAEA
ncbi:MAG: SRPBCC family protein [Candidatus Rokubacteria bacterium]|nr:SRPBCC family protein [Candidatus Rokubacteria bacterium]